MYIGIYLHFMGVHATPNDPEQKAMAETVLTHMGKLESRLTAAAMLDLMSAVWSRRIPPPPPFSFRLLPLPAVWLRTQNPRAQAWCPDTTLRTREAMQAHLGAGRLHADEGEARVGQDD